MCVCSMYGLFQACRDHTRIMCPRFEDSQAEMKGPTVDHIILA